MRKIEELNMAYSLDLRERVIRFLENNDDKKLASALFGVDRSTIYRWIKHKKESGKFFRDLK